MSIKKVKNYASNYKIEKVSSKIVRTETEDFYTNAELSKEYGLNRLCLNKENETFQVLYKGNKIPKSAVKIGSVKYYINNMMYKNVDFTDARYCEVFFNNVDFNNLKFSNIENKMTVFHMNTLNDVVFKKVDFGSTAIQDVLGVRLHIKSSIFNNSSIDFSSDSSKIEFSRNIISNTRISIDNIEKIKGNILINCHVNSKNNDEIVKLMKNNKLLIMGFNKSFFPKNAVENKIELSNEVLDLYNLKSAYSFSKKYEKKIKNHLSEEKRFGYLVKLERKQRSLIERLKLKDSFDANEQIRFDNDLNLFKSKKEKFLKMKSEKKLYFLKNGDIYAQNSGNIRFLVNDKNLVNLSLQIKDSKKPNKLKIENVSLKYKEKRKKSEEAYRKEVEKMYKEHLETAFSEGAALIVDKTENNVDINKIEETSKNKIFEKLNNNEKLERQKNEAIEFNKDEAIKQEKELRRSLSQKTKTNFLKSGGGFKLKRSSV